MKAYNYKLRIGNTFFDVSGDLEFNWSEIDRQFLAFDQDEAAVSISVFLKRVDQLPFGNLKDNASVKEAYAERGLTVYSWKNQEIREYQSFYYKGAPVYAQSTKDETGLHIWVKGEDAFFRHPNFHLWNIMHLENYLLENSAIVLHCCYMAYKNEAILFSAPSGTGKTTQGKLWERVFSSEIINGDRGLLQREPDGHWQVCGYPYHGSAKECRNLSFPIKAIVVVRQAPEDQVIKLSSLKKNTLVFSECTVNTWNPDQIEKTLNLVEDLCAKVEVCQLNCTMNTTAADALHEYLYSEDTQEKK